MEVEVGRHRVGRQLVEWRVREVAARWGRLRRAAVHLQRRAASTEAGHQQICGARVQLHTAAHEGNVQVLAVGRLAAVHGHVRCARHLRDVRALISLIDGELQLCHVAHAHQRSVDGQP